MNDAQIAKLEKFANDSTMLEAVKYVFFGSFLKPKKETDVQYLAASRIAIDLMNDAFKELERYKESPPEKEKKGGQFAL